MVEVVMIDLPNNFSITEGSRFSHKYSLAVPIPLFLARPGKVWAGSSAGSRIWKFLKFCSIRYFDSNTFSLRLRPVLDAFSWLRLYCFRDPQFHPTID